MTKKDNSQEYVCKLCNKQYTYDEMSEEHYPAKSVGNDDIGNFNLNKFFDIIDLLYFKIHSCYKMTNIFGILYKNYELVKGVGETGGYHGLILMQRILIDRMNKINESKKIINIHQMVGIYLL